MSLPEFCTYMLHVFYFFIYAKQITSDIAVSKPIMLAVCAGKVVWKFSSPNHLSFLSPSLLETTRYRLNY